MERMSKRIVPNSNGWWWWWCCCCCCYCCRRRQCHSFSPTFPALNHWPSKMFGVKTYDIHVRNGTKNFLFLLWPLFQCLVAPFCFSIFVTITFALCVLSLADTHSHILYVFLVLHFCSTWSLLFHFIAIENPSNNKCTNFCWILFCCSCGKNVEMDVWEEATKQRTKKIGRK